MKILPMFLSYVELQRAAEDCKTTRGAFDPITVEAFKQANEAKRKLVEILSAIDNELKDAEETLGDWTYE